MTEGEDIVGTLLKPDSEERHLERLVPVHTPVDVEGEAQHLRMMSS
jgi:hypothetical protein